MEKAERPLPNLLVRGFQFALRNWPCLVWAYAVNLFFGLLAAVPFTTGLAPYLDHSLAAQRIAGTIDVASFGELGIHLRESGFFPIVVHTSVWLNLVQLLLLFFLFSGAVFVFVSAEPPTISVMLRGGVAYFFRFLRAAVLAVSGGAVLLAVLLGLRAALLAWAGETHVGREMFYYEFFSGAVVLLAALLVRLWWDLVEVYIVRNAMEGESSVRRALLPAYRVLSQHFFRVFGSFLLSGAAGVCALGLCLYLWKELVPPRQVWMAFVLAQAGLFWLLACRFWQRGLETALVMSVSPPMVPEKVIAAMVEEEAPASSNLPVLMAVPEPPLSDPTLRDLVLKLQTQPLASSQPVPPPRSPAPPKVEPPLGGPRPGEDSKEKPPSPSSEKP